MAKFTPGPAVAAVSGSVGGTTFSRNRYGAYMRFRAKPTIATGEYAVAAKALMTTATQAWASLTAGQRLAWQQWGRENPIVGSLGFPQALTGHAAFVGSYCRLFKLGQAAPTDPPILPAPPGLTVLSVVADKTAGTANVTFAPTPLAAGNVLWFRACQVSSSGIQYVENLLRWCPISAIAPNTPYDAFANFEGRIGALVIGYEFYLLAAVANITTGLISSPLRCTDTIV